MQLGTPLPTAPFEERVEQIRLCLGSQSRAIFDRVVDRVDPAEVARLQLSHGHQFDISRPLAGGPQTGYVKYLDVAYWTADKIMRAETLGLFDTGPKRILDIGCGAGHFLAVCECLGHDAVGIDLSYPVGDAVAELLGVDRRITEVCPGSPLPANLGRFDIVTAFAIKFDERDCSAQGSSRYWTDADWDYFLRHVTGEMMCYPGLLHLQFNQRITIAGNKAAWKDGLAQFERLGARVAGRKSEIWLTVNRECGFL